MIITIKTTLAYLIPLIPLFGAGIIGEGDNLKISTSNVIGRILEVGILGGVLLYAAVQVMHTKIEVIENNAQEIKIELLEIKEEMKAHIKTCENQRDHMVQQLQETLHSLDTHNITHEFYKDD